jgi:hypothetical protein
MGGQGLVVVLEKMYNKIKVQGLWDLATELKLWLESLVPMKCSLQQKKKEQKMHTNHMQQTSATMKMRVKLPLIC